MTVRSRFLQKTWQRYREPIVMITIALGFLGCMGLRIQWDFAEHQARLQALQAQGALPLATPDSQTTPNRTVEAAIRYAIDQNLIPNGDNDCLTGEYRYQLARYGLRVDCRGESEPEWQGYGIIPPPPEAAMRQPLPAAQSGLLSAPAAQ
ncbi:hypothetical protein [Synechococcus elongatus]|uniref:Lipoprotein n=2 Tax=Synechococcus elongatus TaxID=32046 RepID=Q31KU6_SYNE7|nr:hypothetical protein [Synechococcus elongatus]ABB58323.1 conserved hypothetical protein [Synechococcus elongatus PCC 7942 = FACHB-805]AJD57211.1 hypothetical protein M744_04835 [Synechococcus elongatus UTEX 2973]MBD2587046.1 hypothetical protein [Synechococcus elongatus FACHB-242]MBD2688117.1 hypothetical protein [Synechococcus elongatus FACHB-1061]MBD2706172.1 hypothetical protein [Synechococcus elongatus PCC 7942 = FACHB-805]